MCLSRNYQLSYDILKATYSKNIWLEKLLNVACITVFKASLPEQSFHLFLPQSSPLLSTVQRLVHKQTSECQSCQAIDALWPSASPSPIFLEGANNMETRESPSKVRISWEVSWLHTFLPPSTLLPLSSLLPSSFLSIPSLLSSIRIAFILSPTLTVLIIRVTAQAPSASPANLFTWDQLGQIRGLPCTQTPKGQD